jgi:hypothetical protein
MTRREAADYIAALVDELKSIAQAAGLPLIAYLLAMAKEEALSPDDNSFRLC